MSKGLLSVLRLALLPGTYGLRTKFQGEEPLNKIMTVFLTSQQDLGVSDNSTGIS